MQGLRNQMDKVTSADRYHSKCSVTIALFETWNKEAIHRSSLYVLCIVSYVSHYSSRFFLIEFLSKKISTWHKLGFNDEHNQKIERSEQSNTYVYITCMYMYSNITCWLFNTPLAICFFTNAIGNMSLPLRGLTFNCFGFERNVERFWDTTYNP